jgi:DNA polymerase I
MNLKKFLLIDSNSIIHRAYHALPELNDREGNLVNAVYGFFSVLIKTIKDINPSHISTSFDLSGPTFRHKEFKEYKQKRPPTPKELIDQFQIIKTGLKKIEIPIFEKKGFEADDIIGTISKTLEKDEVEVIILSGDRDNLQLASNKIKIFLIKKGIKEVFLYGPEEVLDNYKVKPSQLIDLKSLIGDPSDNISGVPGIGPKTATDLIIKFKTLEGVYENIDSSKIPLRVSEKLKNNKTKAFSSKRLVTIKRDVSFDFELEDCFWNGYNEEIEGFFEKMNFKTLINRIKEEPIKKTMTLI